MKKIVLSAVAILAFGEELEKLTVVSSNNVAQEIKEVTHNISIITSEDLKLGGYLSVVDALGSVAGLNLARSGGMGQQSSVFVRGMDTSKMLVLIDGVRINNPSSLNGAELAYLDIGSIERIEIIKGASSSVWGADGSAGVINIITKSAKEGLMANANASYGSFNTLDTSAELGYKVDGLSVMLYGGYLKSDGFSARATDLTQLASYEKDSYENKNYQVKLGYEITPTNKIEIMHKELFATSAYDNASPDDATSKVLSNEAFSKFNFNHIDSFNVFNLNLNHSYFNNDYQDASYPWKMRAEVYEAGVNSKIGYGEHGFVHLGGDYKEYADLESGSKYDSKGVFVTNHNQLGDASILTESIRYEMNSKYQNALTYKIGAKQYFEKVFLSANYATGYNAPSFYQQKYADYSLIPESSTTYDVSLGGYGFEASVFSGAITNLVEYYSDASWNSHYKNTAGISVIQGVEVAYAEDFKELALKVNTNYTYLDAKDKDGKTLARRAEQSAYLGFDYYAIANLHALLDAKYIGTRYDGLGKTGAMTGDYVVANMALNYKIDDNFAIFAKIENLLDRVYAEVNGYATARRSYYAGLNASF